MLCLKGWELERGCEPPDPTVHPTEDTDRLLGDPLDDGLLAFNELQQLPGFWRLVSVGGQGRYSGSHVALLQSLRKSRVKSSQDSRNT